MFRIAFHIDRGRPFFAAALLAAPAGLAAACAPDAGGAAGEGGGILAPEVGAQAVPAARLARIEALFPGVLPGVLRPAAPLETRQARGGRGERAPLARVRLGATAAEATRVEDVETGLALAFRLSGARGEAPGERLELGDDGGGALALYPGAYEGGDIVVRAGPDGAEDFVFFERAPAREALVYEIDVGRAAGLRIAGGAIELLDAGGVPRLRVGHAVVLGADGITHEARLELSGCAADRDPRAPWGRPVVAPGAPRCSVRLDWSGAGVAYPALVDPEWISTKEPLARARRGHTATLLDPSDPAGLVLVAGGFDASGQARGEAELYEPLSRTFAGTGSLAGPRGAHAAARTSDEGPGAVILAGGSAQAGGAPLASVERYDPKTGEFESAGTLGTPRQGHTATRIGQGKVLFAGGASLLGQPTKTAEVYDDAKKALGETLNTMGVARSAHVAERLASGRVLLAGGFTLAGFALQSAELFDPETGSFTPVVASSASLSPQLSVGRALFTATRLPSGEILLAGGANDSGLQKVWDTAELFVDEGPARGSRPAAVPMISARAAHTATRLPSGEILLAGGATGPGAEIATTEIFGGSPAAFSAGPTMLAPRRDHAAVLVNAGQSVSAGRGVLVVGGRGDGKAALASAEVLLRQNGEACGAGVECASGHCSAGLCCDTPCNETCRSCSGAVKGDGVDGQCGFSAPLTPAGKQCVNDIAVERTCDGAGDAVATKVIDCKPAACNAEGTECSSFCDAETPCSAVGWCLLGADPGDPDVGACQPKLPFGGECTEDRQCLDGRCVDGVCCDAACEGQCEACDVPGSVGKCSRVGAPEAPEPPHGDRPACAGDTEACTGACTGVSPSACTYPKANACAESICACADEACTAGATAKSYACDGAGTCVESQASCGSSRCGEDGTCLSSCASDADCVLDAFCDLSAGPGVCKPLEGPRCDGDHTRRLPDAPDEDCAPYRCRAGEPACSASCSSVDDCVGGSVCSAAGECVPRPAPQVIGGCSASPSGSRSPGALALALAALLLARRRRPRA